MILHLTSRAQKIVHIPKLLYYWRAHKGSVASNISAKPYAVNAAKEVVANYLMEQGIVNFQVLGTKAFPTIFRIKYEIYAESKVSIIIVGMNSSVDIKKCIISILTKTTFVNYEIIAVVDKSFELNNDTFIGNSRIKILRCNGAFREKAVAGIAESKGEFLLFIHDDTEIITADWIQELLMYAQREDVGAVGGKLCFGDRSIQNAGIVVGIGQNDVVCYPHYKSNMDDLGYMGRLCYAQEISAVSSACLMIRRRHFEEVNGFRVSLDKLSEVDLCMKLRKIGLNNIFTPYCELYHYDNDGYCKHIGNDYEKEKQEFKLLWGEMLKSGDPFYNLNFDFNKNNFSLKLRK